MVPKVKQEQMEQRPLLTLDLLQRSLLEKMLLLRTAVVRRTLLLILEYLKVLLALRVKRVKMVLQ